MARRATQQRSVYRLHNPLCSRGSSKVTSIRLGISTCPNDTFAFHALLHRLVDWRGLEFSVELLDIQELNNRLRRGNWMSPRPASLLHSKLLTGWSCCRADRRLASALARCC
ncbi:MAG: MqnA/MqnD/SBP family protein [Pirellulaceae bacterium]